ncbi:hypothetical protein K7X08_007993 [Anisodus acutangulus]|uniref:Uncharacterized protein n=1 Tax=Anisodus acutangulus TaxID=402998 RepID=A0A9Q1RNQ7_9SOLA|nr:hypothetical protein K7X08_007993 [Anisodus acutangulus]
MARNSENKSSSRSRVSDHFTFARIFHFKNYYDHQYQNHHHVDMKKIEKVVQPSIRVLPHVTDHNNNNNNNNDQYSSWENSSVSDCSSEWAAFRQLGLDSDNGSDGSEYFLGSDPMAGWISSPDIMSSAGNSISGEGSRSKRFKVSSSVMVPPTFSESPLRVSSHLLGFIDLASKKSFKDKLFLLKNLDFTKKQTLHFQGKIARHEGHILWQSGV